MTAVKPEKGKKQPMAKHVQLRRRRTVEIPQLGVKVTDAPKNGHPGVLVELLTSDSKTD